MKKIFSLFLIVLLSLIAFTVYADTPSADSVFTITSPAFLDQNALPVMYSCDGKNIPPEFSWTAAPKKTETFVLILSDPKALNGTFYHWILYNIPKSISQLAEGLPTLPTGALIGKNSAGKLEYNGPCPPHGQAHTYITTLYAVDTKLAVPSEAEGETIEKAMKNHIVGKASISFVYSRWFN